MFSKNYIRIERTEKMENKLERQASKVLIFGFGIILGIIMGIGISKQRIQKSDEPVKAIAYYSEQMGFMEFNEEELNYVYLGELLVRANRQYLIVSSENKVFCQEALVEYLESILSKIPQDSYYEDMVQIYEEEISECKYILEKTKKKHEIVMDLTSDFDEILEHIRSIKN